MSLQAEQQIVDAVRNGYLQARFDHKNNTVHFGGQVGEGGAAARQSCPARLCEESRGCSMQERGLQCHLG